jgi:hypothetical protein
MSKVFLLVYEDKDMTHVLEFPYGTVTLNSEQYSVVTAHPGETQRILAAAGSGKTTTITARIAWLLTHTGVQADQIVLLTFSRNASREMVHRVRRLVGPVSLWSGTFHALAKQVLTLYGGKSESSMLFIDELPVKWMAWLRTEKGRKWVGKLRYIIVDEFQDINAIQWRLLETLRHVGSRMILVGDDAQNIYTWRGSSAGFLLDFHSVVPSVCDYQLKQNYRSTDAIVTVANRVMRGIPTLPWKEHMVAFKKGGMKPDVLFFWRMSDECTWVAKQILALRAADPDATIGVLGRNNTHLYKTEEIFVQNGVRTRILSLEPSSEEEHRTQKDTVDLATFHGSKGLEWDITFLLCLSDDILPAQKTAHAIVGERRLFYVAVTRARRRMFMTYHGNERTLSRFVREIGYQFLTYHGLAKYALSEFEINEGTPSLQNLLDCLDGDDWAAVRASGLLPWNEEVEKPLLQERLLPPGESWHIPEWSDARDFEAFTRLWSKRALLALRGWREEYKDPLRERMIFTVRVFQEDIPFWEEWRDEIDAAMKYFFSDTTRMEPADYGDVEKWALEKSLSWTQKELIAATSLLAKLRGQLRPLRFEPFKLEEFTIRPSHCVVPSEYRVDVLRSWRRFMNPSIRWRECLLDIWRLACLEQVADGRTACLFRVGTMKDKLDECVLFLESFEGALKGLIQDDVEPCFNPEVVPEGLRPTGCDLLIGDSLVRFCGERRPDMYMWVESILLGYLFVSCGLSGPVKQIQIVHPFHGVSWKYLRPDLLKAKRLYAELQNIWTKKQAV